MILLDFPNGFAPGIITISFHQSGIWQVLDQAAQFLFSRTGQYIVCRAKVTKPPQPLSQGTERLNLPLKCFVFVIKPLHHFGAWIRAIVRDFDVAWFGGEEISSTIGGRV